MVLLSLLLFVIVLLVLCLLVALQVLWRFWWEGRCAWGGGLSAQSVWLFVAAVSGKM